MRWKGGHDASTIRSKSRIKSLENIAEEREWFSLEKVSSLVDDSSVEAEVLRQMAPALLDKSMSAVLSPREKAILENFANGGSQSEEAERQKISPQRVSQLREEALSKLRHPLVRRVLRPLLDGFD